MKKIFLISLIVLLQCVCAYSQESQMKSNSSSVYNKKASSNSSDINKYIDSANASILNNPQRSINFSEKALEMSLNSSYRNGEINSYKTLGSIYYYYGKNEVAKGYLMKVVAFMNEKKDYKNYYDAYKLLGLVYKSMDSIAKSEYYFNLYLAQAKKQNDNAKIAEANNNLASLYLKNKQPDKAISYSQNSLNNLDTVAQNVIQQQEVNTNKVTSNYVLGKAYYMKGDKDKATQHFKSSVDDASNTASPVINQNSSNNEMEDNLSFSNSLNTAASTGNSNIAADLNYEIGKIYLKNNDNKAAINYLEKSTQNYQEPSIIAANSEKYKSLSLAYEKSGNIEKALSAYKLYVRSLDSAHVLNNDSVQINSMLENTAKKVKLLENERILNNQTIELLKKEQQLQKYENSTKSFVIGILIVVIILMIVAGFFIIRTIQQK